MKPGLMNILKESGPVPGEENGVKKRKDEEGKKRKRGDKNVSPLRSRLTQLYAD